MSEPKVTIRGLAGEIWAELAMRSDQGISPFDRLENDVLGQTIDVVLGVLARHENEKLTNDTDRPVSVLPELVDPS